MTKLVRLLVILMMLAACGVRDATPPALPTVVPFDVAATALALTKNAPPPGYETVSFPRVDANLNLLPGWRYEVDMIFDGVFARTPRPTAASTRATVEFNQVASARRVLTTVDNDIESPNEPVQYEAVRLGPDAFLLRDGVCLSNASEDAELAADFGAGALIGGVQQAANAAKHATINGEEVWLYTVTPESLVLPNVQLDDTSIITSATGELWYSPQRNVVIRYYLMLELENARVFNTPLPVSGTLRISYDVYDIGSAPNLSVPFGC
jgi:hypothetical protein